MRVPTNNQPIPFKDRRWMTLAEMVSAGQFYRVGLKVEGLQEEVTYDIPSNEVSQAIHKALDKHNRMFDFGGDTEPLEECKTGKVIRYKVKTRTDEEALDELWNRMEPWYMQYWDSDVSTSRMLGRIQRTDPKLYREIKSYTVPVWSNAETLKAPLRRPEHHHR